MKELFSKYGIELSESKEEKFNKYYEILTFYNNKFNITAITEKEEVSVKHFLDSVLGLKYINGNKILDVGAGGGFPSIPLKIMNENLNFTLLEATGKKCEFLKEVVKELNLKGVEVINGRAEDLGKDNKYREKYDTVVARAVARLNALSEYCMPFVKVGGKFISYKGKETEEIEEAKNAIKILGGELEKTEYINYEGIDRNFVIIKKIKETEKKYPRGNGKERKNPL